jgi:hypothetical protein
MLPHMAQIIFDFFDIKFDYLSYFNYNISEKITVHGEISGGTS